MSEEALRTLQAVADEMLRRGIGAGGLAGVVQDDPDWVEVECTRRHVALLWAELNDAVTAEVGSALARRLPNWAGTWEPQIVVGEPEDFDYDYLPDQPYGWLPLAKAHHREAEWDWRPAEESGTWIGWWEPERSSGSVVTGLLSGFIIVANGNLEFAHTVKRRRRTGVASKLVGYATAHHGLKFARGHRTPDGEAFARALGL